jgi:hypothetical protein
LSDSPSPTAYFIKKELALLGVMLLFGITILPIAIWFVGNLVFGSYGGAGYGDFFGTLGAKIRTANPVAWFLVLSPWLALQVVRLAVFGWRKTGEL